MQLYQRIEQIGTDILGLIVEHEQTARRNHRPPSELFLAYNGHATLSFDPQAERTGFVLQLRMETNVGAMEATFSPDGELVRGLVGSTVVMDPEYLIEMWNQARGHRHDAVHAPHELA